MALEDGEAAAQFAREQLVVDVEDDVREEEVGACKRERERETRGKNGDGETGWWC